MLLSTRKQNIYCIISHSKSAKNFPNKHNLLATNYHKKSTGSLNKLFVKWHFVKPIHVHLHSCTPHLINQSLHKTCSHTSLKRTTKQKHTASDVEKKLRGVHSHDKVKNIFSVYTSVMWKKMDDLIYIFTNTTASIRTTCKTSLFQHSLVFWLVQTETVLILSYLLSLLQIPRCHVQRLPNLCTVHQYILQHNLVFRLMLTQTAVYKGFPICAQSTNTFYNTTWYSDWC